MRGKFGVTLPPRLFLECFNEARALCAGSSGLRLRSAKPTRSFNEARALCAGSSFAHSASGTLCRASMRPAHCAREV